MNEENRKEDGLEREEAMAEEFSDTELSDSLEAEQEQKDQADSQDHAEDGDAGEEEQEGTKDPSKEPAKKGFFGKKKEKKDPKDTQIEELTDRVRRTMAEFDNFRKRSEKEKSAMFEIGAKDIIERILPVIDNFERGLSLSLIHI